MSNQRKLTANAGCAVVDNQDVLTLFRSVR
jgi:hypothetical protein